MAMLMKRWVLAMLSVVVFAGGAFAQDVEGAVKARQGLMQVYAHYLGTLGAMAKGEVDYNAEAAGAAAASLAALTSLDQSNLWPQGSDNEALGDKTRALPALWTTWPAVAESGKAYREAVAAMADAAGTDLASLQGAMKDLGGSCGGCHKLYRQPSN